MTRLYTLDKALNTLGPSPKQVICCGVVLTLASASWTVEYSFFTTLFVDFQCQNKLESVATTTSIALFLFSLALGGLYFGWVADVKGRLVSLRIAVATSVYFGLFSVIIKDGSFWQSLAVKLITFFACGGQIVVSVVYFIENLPKSQGRLLLLFLAVGSMLGNLLIYLTEFYWRSKDYRIPLLLQRIPITLYLVFTLFMGESIRYHDVIGDFDGTMKQLREISKSNQRSLPKGNLVVHKALVLGSLKALFWIRPENIFIIITLSAVLSTTYMGTVQWGLIQFSQRFGFLRINDDLSLFPCPAKKVHLQLPSYFVSFSSLAEGIFLVLAAVFVNVFGRKRLMLLQIACLIGLFATLALYKEETATVIISYLVRGISAVCPWVLYLYVAELYPTKSRCVATGFVYFCGTTFMMLMSILVSELLESSHTETAFLLMFFSIVSGILVLLLMTRIDKKMYM